MIVWINGPFGVGKTTITRELVKLLPNVVTFDPEEVGFMLRHALGPHYPGGDFQELRAWRRLTVAALAEMADYLSRDILVPQSVLVESHWDELHDGLAQLGIDTLSFTVHAQAAELTRRITADTVLADAVVWRLDHRSVYDTAHPWLSEKTTLLDTTTFTPAETAELIAKSIDQHRKESRDPLGVG